VQSLHFHTDGGSFLHKIFCHTDNGLSYPLKSDTVFSSEGSGEKETPQLPAIQHSHSGMVNFVHSRHCIPLINEQSIVYWQRGVTLLKCDNGEPLLAEGSASLQNQYSDDSQTDAQAFPQQWAIAICSQGEM